MPGHFSPTTIAVPMVRCVTGWWAAAGALSGAVALLAALALCGFWACGAGPAPAGEQRGTESAVERHPEPEPEPASSPGSEAAERRERDGREGEHDSEREHDSGDEHGKESGESGIRYGVSETARESRGGVELVLRFDASAGAFVGTATNTGAEPVERVRVEVHLIGGPELGPSPTVTLAPGETGPVRLEAEGHRFETWTAHVEIGEGEHGEHGKRHR